MNKVAATSAEIKATTKSQRWVVEMNEIAIRSEPGIELHNNFNTLIDACLSSQDVKQTSRSTYRKALKRFMEWISSEGLYNPTREDVLRYKAFLEAQGLSSLTQSTYLVTVRRFFEWAEGMKYCLNVAKGIKGSKRTKGFRKDPLTLTQVREFLGSIDRFTLQGKRDYALLNLLIRTGLRTIEVIRADVGDIRQQGGEALLWIQGKGRDSKDEFVLLTEETLKPTREYLHARGNLEDHDPLFASLSDRNRNQRLTTLTIRRIAKQYLRRLGLDSKRLTAHSLRHTAITLALQAGATIQEAQALGRHADINTTLIYAHNINRIVHAPERKIDALLGEFE